MKIKNGLLPMLLILMPFSLGHAEEQPEDISMIALIANPEKYDGAFVRIHGWMKLEFEGDAIYVSKDDREFLNTKNGLWVNFEDGFLTKEKRQELRSTFALVEGIFDAKAHGHMGLFSGTIKNIKRAITRERMRGR